MPSAEKLVAAMVMLVHSSLPPPASGTLPFVQWAQPSCGVHAASTALRSAKSVAYAGGLLAPVLRGDKSSMPAAALASWNTNGSSLALAFLLFAFMVPAGVRLSLMSTLP